MKKGIITTIILILLCVIGYMILLETETVRNYKIKDFDIVANVDMFGNMKVIEETEYRFNGKYNGITITLPKNISKNYYDKMTQNSINDSVFEDYLYNNKGLEDVSIYIVRDGKREKITEVSNASLGESGVYTVEYDENGYVTYRIYEPSKNENKTFVIEYTLKDVAVMHSDVGEVFWNFVGGKVECRIDNLDIALSINSGNIETGYIHGNESGRIMQLDKNTIRVNYKHVGKNEFVGVRVVFPKTSIKDSTKISKTNGINVIQEQENGYSQKSKLRITLNVVSIIITAVLLLYWIYLLVRYEKDILYKVEDFDEVGILEKYNPIIAACIAQNRDMHPRDILAALIDLVNRKVLSLETIKTVNSKNGKEELEYKLTKNKYFFNDEENKLKLNDIDIKIIDIFFEKDSSISLKSKLKNMKKDNRTLKKISRLDEIVVEKLERIGANFVRVPKSILTLNNVIFVLVIMFAIVVLIININLGYATNTSGILSEKSIVVFILIVSLLLVCYPLTCFFYFILTAIGMLFKIALNKIAFKFSGKKLTQTLISLAITFAIIFVIEKIFIHNSYVIILTILVMMSYLIISTDNLMSSHSHKVRNDYFYLKSIQDKIENGSLLNDKGIESQILWEKYLSFAIALGVGNVAGLVASIPNINDIVKDFDNCSDKLYDIYVRNRNIEIENKIEKISNKISSILEDSCSSEDSFFGGSSSSFGGGGFSGGGGGGGGRGAF